MLVIGNVATRRRGWAAHVVIGFGTALLAAFVNAGVVILIALVAPSDDSWIYAIAAIATLVAFLIAALVGLLLTHLVVVRRRPAEPETASEIAPVEASA
jgi:Na+/melibiose symporter-like transporter